MKHLRAIVLAAGKGTRMKSSVPKVLHSVCGKPLITYVLDVVKAVGSLKSCVVLGHQNEKVQESLPKDFDVAIQDKLLGTADAVKCTEKFFKGYKGDVLILCGDTPLLREETIKALVKQHKKTDANCTFLTAVVEDSSGYGRILRGPDGKAVGIREENDATEYEKNIVEINVGVYCFKSEVLFREAKRIQINKKKKEFYLTDIVENLARQKLKIETVETEDPTEGLGVNTLEDLAVAGREIRNRIMRDLMLDGVTVIDPATTYIDADVRIGKDTIIRPFTVIEENVQVGSHCVIGPFARLRPGTKIGNHVEVGNFTEVSRTQMGDKTLMKHFSFLGDAQVGSGVNIGAGVVTANYDGQKKSKTQISNQAFIGSDSILVAPVKIGKKAKTGAGCVVTRGKTVPDGSVIVGIPGRVLDKK